MIRLIGGAVIKFTIWPGIVFFRSPSNFFKAESVNTILLFDSDFISPNRVSISGRRLNHIRATLKASTGDVLKVGKLNSYLGKGKIAVLSDSACEMEVSLTDAPPAPLPCTLILALPRPKSFKKALETAVVMGVKRVFIIESWRVEKSYWSSPVLDFCTLNEIMYLALEQACDTMLPDIQLRRRFKPFVEDELSAVIQDNLALVAHPGVTEKMSSSAGQRVTLVIGPEGGFIPYEVNLLEKFGCRPVSFNERILRVEHAVAAFLGRLF